ncbi:thiol-disulfide oxidoreductase DCC family protein [Gelidibacter salicanalis]|uniref:Thiol-disulfide oxidoreductase DCC family protein n=1 Tax=Gelidibacter salicanalis TaxID=291193 RepID=A0A5C7AC67_9FLAO|nr:thiol-disulfide oxidoreductase DCC family protein [Gelidibacter salicanalis]TXE06021.1 thiol-disulfide oxidoreductase DCC family protein [Gelidibacter salicanalis]
MSIPIEKNKQLILFDGVCNLCNTSVQYVIKNDQQDVFRYTALQSAIGQEVLEHFKIDRNETDSILLYSESDGISYKSTAALKIVSKLGFPRNLLAIFLIVPAFIRNWVYDYIAKNRYKWYGQKDECMIPTPELKSKFL